VDEVTWIEVLSRHRDVVARQRVTGGVVRVGRAYDNDLVLDDPHVAAHHLRFVRGDDGTWSAEDLGSANGLRVDGKRRAQAPLDGDVVVVAGHTGLRLRTSAYAVAEELPLARRGVPHWAAALACLALVFALAVLELWLGETGETKLIRYLTPLLTLAVVIAVWVSAWTVLSRLFAGHARFGLHLLIVGAGLLAYACYEQLAEIGAFALSWTALAGTVYVGAWLVFAAVCYAHLRALGRARLPLKAACALALAALGISMQTLKLSDWRADYGQPDTLKRLEPPSLRLVGARAPAAFYADAAALQAVLDRARSEAPTGGDAAADAPDDED